MATNAYVKLNIRPNGVFLTLYPAVDGGKSLIIDEVEKYLDKIFPGYEKVIVREELKKPLLPRCRSTITTTPCVCRWAT